jgi:hypothetical protein
MEIKNDELIKILSHFPKIDYAIAYGSSVIPQIGYNIEKNKNSVIDFIFGIKDSKAWHYKNLEKKFSSLFFFKIRRFRYYFKNTTKLWRKSLL